MRRRTIGTVLAILVFCLSAAAGYWWQGIRRNHALDGWCCIDPGSACTAAQSPKDCRDRYGMVFDRQRDVCDGVCRKFGSVR